MADPWNNIPGNPASWPANIRAVGGGENRTSTIFDREISDLADRTAYLAKAGVNKQLIYAGDLIVSSQATVTSNSKTPTQFLPALSTTIVAAAGDVLDIVIGPILETAITTSSGLLLAIAEGAGTPVTKFLLGLPNGGLPLFEHMRWEYNVATTSTVSIVLYVVSNGTDNIVARVEEGVGTWNAGSGSFTVSHYTWGTIKQFRLSAPA